MHFKVLDPKVSQVATLGSMNSKGAKDGGGHE